MNPTNQTNELPLDEQRKQKVLYDKIMSGKMAIPTFDEKMVINRIAVLPEPSPEVMKAGLHIPDAFREKPQRGIVVDTGEGRITEHGVLIKTLVSIGDRVQFGKYSGTYIYNEQFDVMLIVMLDGDCLTRKPQPRLVAKQPEPINSVLE